MIGRILLSLSAFVSAATAQHLASPPARVVSSSGAAVSGSYEATLVNRRPLPTNDRVDASPGYEHAVELDQMVLTLKTDGRFNAIVKYHQSMVRKREKAEVTPIMSASVRGKYTVNGTSIRFDPDPNAKGGRVKPITGTIAGRHIVLPIDYKGGTPLVRRFILELDKNDNIW